MGDSYSTFEGWSNKDMAGNDNDYYVYYPHECPLTGVDCVEKTWWYMLCQKPEFELEVSITSQIRDKLTTRKKNAIPQI